MGELGEGLVGIFLLPLLKFLVQWLDYVSVVNGRKEEKKNKKRRKSYLPFTLSRKRQERRR